MKVICVDDVQLAVDYTVEQCKQLKGISEVNGFTRAMDALSWLETHPVDLAILDINMPEMNGIALAAEIKRLYPQAAILFLTAHKEYALDAYSVHPAGYLLKPVSQEMLADEVAYVFSDKHPGAPAHIEVRTFGNFDLFVDGKPVHFKLAKSKELLAYLVDKQGCGVTRREVFSALWEDKEYDRRMQKQLDVYIRSLRDTLHEYGIAGIMEIAKGTLRVIPKEFTCDAYLFFDGDSDAINSYRGVYMGAYSWASFTESAMHRIIEE